jgi:hypothetical protein
VQHDARLERLEDVVVAPSLVVGDDVGHEKFLRAAYADFRK